MANFCIDAQYIPTLKALFVDNLQKYSDDYEDDSWHEVSESNGFTWFCLFDEKKNYHWSGFDHDQHGIMNGKNYSFACFLLALDSLGLHGSNELYDEISAAFDYLVPEISNTMEQLDQVNNMIEWSY